MLVGIGWGITPRMLPQSERVRFALLSPAELKALADRYDHFLCLTLGKVMIAGDSAVVTVGTSWVPSARRPRTVYMSGGACRWQYRKRDGHWEFEKPKGCVIS